MTLFLFFFFLLPLLFNPFGLKGFLLPKLGWLALGLMIQSFLWIKQKKSLKLSSLSLVWLAYALFLLLAALFSVSPLLGFKGSYQRFEGGLSFLLLFLFLVAAGNQEKQKLPFRWLVWAGCVVVALALLQQAKLLPLSSSERAFSTLGQPNFFASYLLMLLPLTLLFCFPLSLVYALWLILGIVLSQSRAALVALPPLLFCSALLFKEKKKTLLGLSFAFLFLITATLASSPHFRQRLSGLVSLNDKTVKVRLLVWDKSIRIAAHHPLLGVGPENFQFAFFKVKPIEINRLEGVESFADRAHNLFLDEALKGGLFGFFLFALFCCLLFFTFRQEKNQLEAKVALLILLAFLLVHQASFPTLVPLLFLLYFAGRTSGKAVATLPAWFFPWLASLLFLFFASYNAADLLAKQGVSMMSEDAVHLSLPPLKLISRAFPFEPKYRFFQGQALLYAYEQTREIRYAKQAVAALQKAHRMVPQDPFPLANLGIAYGKLAFRNPMNQKKAEQSFGLATALFPANAHFFHKWAIFVIKRGEPQKALQLLKKASALADNDPLILADLGLLYQRLGAYPESERFLKKSLSYRPMSETYDNLGVTYYRSGKWLAAREAFLQARSLDPDNPRAYNNIGALNMKMGQYDQAEENFKRVLSLDPDGSMGKLACHNLISLSRHLQRPLPHHPACAQLIAEEKKIGGG